MRRRSPAACSTASSPAPLLRRRSTSTATARSGTFRRPTRSTTNFSFFTQPGQTDQRWLVIFDNVVHTGNMSCNAVHGHKIWFTNGSSSTLQPNCQNLLIPVEKIDKQNPAGPDHGHDRRAVHLHAHDPGAVRPGHRARVINNQGSPNDLHGITVWDDLNATGADLTYVSHVAYWEGSGTPLTECRLHVLERRRAPHLRQSAPGIVPGRASSSSSRSPSCSTTRRRTRSGTQFVNTAKWDFGRLIDGVFYRAAAGRVGHHRRR